MHAKVARVGNAQRTGVRMIAAGVSDVEGEAGRCSKRFDLGRPGLLGDGRCSQTTKVRPNVSTTVAANLADEQTFDIRQPQMIWPAIG